MSMIGLFTATPQATGTKATTGSAATAAGFGSTLQGALDALAQGSAEAPASLVEPPETPQSLVETVETPAAETTPTPSLVELVETATGNSSGVSTGSTSESLPAAATTPLVELVETPAGNPVHASATTPLVELVETPTGSSSGVSTSSTSGSLPASAPTPLVEFVETPTGNPVHASLPTARPADSGGSSVPGSVAPGAASATVPASATTPLVELVETPTSKPVPASTSSATGVTPVAAVPLVDARTGSPLPSSTNPANATVPASTTSVAAVPTPPTPAGASAEPAPVQTPTAVAAPASTPIQSTAPAAPTAAPAPAQPVPFTSQLARPIFSLAAAGAGEHVMTVSVTPDSLGPVTVRAHVGADGVRVELFAPNDLGRDAIRAIIPELRRDLAGAGLGGNLSLSSQNQPASDGAATGSHAGQAGDRDAQRGGPPQASATQADGSPVASEPEVDRAGLFGTTSTIDVLA